MKIEYTKQQLRDLSPPDYHYAGAWDGLYHFTKNDYSEGYFTTSCNHEDLTNGNLEYMCKNGFTRTLNRFNYE